MVIDLILEVAIRTGFSELRPEIGENLTSFIAFEKSVNMNLNKPVAAEKFGEASKYITVENISSQDLEKFLKYGYLLGYSANEIMDSRKNILSTVIAYYNEGYLFKESDELYSPQWIRKLLKSNKITIPYFQEIVQIFKSSPPVFLMTWWDINTKRSLSCINKFGQYQGLDLFLSILYKMLLNKKNMDFQTIRHGINSLLQCIGYSIYQNANSSPYEFQNTIIEILSKNIRFLQILFNLLKERRSVVSLQAHTSGINILFILLNSLNGAKIIEQTVGSVSYTELFHHIDDYNSALIDQYRQITVSCRPLIEAKPTNEISFNIFSQVQEKVKRDILDGCSFISSITGILANWKVLDVHESIIIAENIGISEIDFIHHFPQYLARVIQLYTLTKPGVVLMSLDDILNHPEISAKTPTIERYLRWDVTYKQEFPSFLMNDEMYE